MAEKFAMIATAVTATSAVTILNAGFASIKLLRSINICNVHTANTAAATVSVTLTNTAAEYVVSAYTQVSSQQSIEVLSQPLVLNNFDTLRIKCDPVDEIHIVASYLDIE
jgi:hypothetical protein